MSVSELKNKLIEKIHAIHDGKTIKRCNEVIRYRA